MKSVRQTRRTRVLRRLHTGMRMLPKDLSKNSKMGWQYTCMRHAWYTQQFFHTVPPGDVERPKGAVVPSLGINRSRFRRVLTASCKAALSDP